MAKPINHREDREPQEMPTHDEALRLLGNCDNFILHAVINPAAESDLLTLTDDEMEAVYRYAMIRMGAQRRRLQLAGP